MRGHKASEADIAKMREMREKGMSYRAIGDALGFGETTVRDRLKPVAADVAEVAQKKRDERAASLLEYMESQTPKVQEIVGLGLERIMDMMQDPEYLKATKQSAQTVATALGIVIDKWAAANGPLKSFSDRKKAEESGIVVLPAADEGEE